MPTSRPSDPDPTANLVVLTGVLRGDVLVRTVGAVDVAGFDLATPTTRHGPSAVVPVSWTTPPAAELDLLSDGAEVTVLGSVTKRFYRAGGVTRATTEVVVDRLVPTRRRRSVTSLRASAVALLDGAT